MQMYKFRGHDKIIIAKNIESSKKEVVMIKRVRIFLSGKEEVDKEALKLLSQLKIKGIKIVVSYDAVAIFPKTGKLLPAVRTDEGDRYYGVEDIKLLVNRVLKGRELA
ncbi:hypothetical protein KKG15_01870 [Patescibacteria group bacterium]|nr:hypothetical protein [Patescibacteria group bacterium]